MKIQMIDSELNRYDITIRYKVMKISSIILSIMFLIITTLYACKNNVKTTSHTNIERDTIREKEVVVFGQGDLKQITKQANLNIPTFCHNPGCIMRGNPVIDAMAIGTIHAPQGDFLFFPNDETGFKALKYLLSTVYGNSTVRQCIHRYCPTYSNGSITSDENLYVSNICKELKISENHLIKNINVDKLALTIARIEGWNPQQEK
jgi:hypothetical protein